MWSLAMTIGEAQTTALAPAVCRIEGRTTGIGMELPGVSLTFAQDGKVRSATSPEQRIYFYYEVYDPALAERAPALRTSLAFYRGSVKVYETPVVERTMVDDTRRQAVLFRFEVPASSFTAGNYICQINIIDALGTRAAFPRLTFTVVRG